MTFATNGLIEASDFNSLVDTYHAIFQLSGGIASEVQRVSAGSVVTAAHWSALINAIASHAAMEGRTVSLPNLSMFGQGKPIKPFTIGTVSAIPSLEIIASPMTLSAAWLSYTETANMVFLSPGYPVVRFPSRFAVMPATVNVVQHTKITRLWSSTGLPTGVIQDQASAATPYHLNATGSAYTADSSNNHLGGSVSYTLGTGHYRVEVYFVANDPSGRWSATSGTVTFEFEIDASIPPPPGPDGTNPEYLTAFRITSNSWSEFANTYGIWFLPSQQATTLIGTDVGLSVPVNFPVSGVYRMEYRYDDCMRVAIDNTTIFDEQLGPHHANIDVAWEVPNQTTGSITFWVDAGTHYLSVFGRNGDLGNPDHTYDFNLNPACVAFVLYDPSGNVIATSTQWADSGLTQARCPQGYICRTLPNGNQVCVPL